MHRAWAPLPSPDGRSVAFLSDAAGLPQAYAADAGATPSAESVWRRLVTSRERVQFVAWAPDGRFVFNGRDTGGDENTHLLRSSADGAHLVSLVAEPRVKSLFGGLSDDGRSIADATNARSGGDFDIYVRPTADGDARRVFEAPGHHEASSFSPDGTRLLVLEERSNFDQDVFVVDVAASTSQRLTPHEGDVRFGHPAFTRDGRGAYVLSDAGREAMNLAWLPVDRALAGTPTCVVSDPHDADHMALRCDALALVFNVDGVSSLRLYDAVDPMHPREVARPALPPGVITTVSFGADGHALLEGWVDQAGTLVDNNSPEITDDSSCDARGCHWVVERSVPDCGRARWLGR